MTIEKFLEEAEAPEEIVDEANQKKQRKACGYWAWVIMPDGQSRAQFRPCGDHRGCDNCRELKFEREILPSLTFAHNHNDELRFLSLKEGNETEAFQKWVSRHEGEYKRFPQPDGSMLIIHNVTEDVKGERLEMWDIGYNDEGAKLDFQQIIQDVPTGKSITGKLGKKRDEEPEKREDEPEEEKVKVRQYHLYTKNATEKEEHLSFYQAIKATQNINVASVEGLEAATFKRVTEWKKALGDGDDVFTFYTWTYIPEKDLKLWNKNPNNGVQITSTKESSRDNTDIQLQLSKFLEQAL